jgi:CDP-glycerol glycerophosphotransferase (TagB/SpsB family)
MFSPLGYWLTMRAGAILCTHPHTSDHNLFAVGGRTRIIQLWHGTPIKKIGRDDQPLRVRTATPLVRARRAVNRACARVFPWLRDRIDAFAAASEAVVANYMSALGLARAAIHVTGQPRTDVLLRGEPRPAAGPRILYMPTFRGEVGDRVDLLAGFDLAACERVLSEIGGTLSLRIHPSNQPDEGTFRALLKSPRIGHFDAEDVYAELATFDMLITDYSSILFDYLLLDRPVVFAPFDLDAYVACDRELYYPYEAVSPGPIARTWPEVFAAIRELAADPRRFVAARQAVRDRFHAFTDGGSCARVVALVQREVGLDPSRP